jgi:hypothetical protein
MLTSKERAAALRGFPDDCALPFPWTSMQALAQLEQIQPEIWVRRPFPSFEPLKRLQSSWMAVVSKHPNKGA